jgi:hypothetical protein
MEDILIFILEQEKMLHNSYDCENIKKGPVLPTYAYNLVYVGDIDKKEPQYNSFIYSHASSIDPYLRAHVGPECADHFGITAPGIVISRNFDKTHVPFKGSTHQELSNLMALLSVPVFGEWNGAQTMPFFSQL